MQSCEKGILLASDAKSEWLLPWWWERYSSCNNLPVAFIDLGMSPAYKEWCGERGVLLTLPDITLSSPSQANVEIWKEQYGESFSSCRQAWLKKPSCCLLSPFTLTAWIDIDCEVLLPLDTIFSYVDKTELAVSFDFPLHPIPHLREESEAGMICNSGVVVFHQDSFLIQQWVEKTKQESEHYFGDECILSSLIFRHPDRVSQLPETFNYRLSRGLPLQAHILHWKGEWGKAFIKEYGGLKPLLLPITNAFTF